MSSTVPPRTLGAAQPTPSPVTLFGAAPVAATESAAVSSATMSPEQIMALLATRLGSIDAGFQQLKRQSDDNARTAAELRKLQSVLGQAIPGQGLPDWAATAAMGKVFDDAADAAALLGKTAADGSSRTDPCGDLVATFRGIAEHCRQGDPTPDSVFTQLKTDIESRLASLHSESESTMMALQQSMQARTQFISLCTNMLASLNESAKGILQNLR